MKRKHEKHGQSKGGHYTKELQAYSNAIQRCKNPKNPMWRWYGGRGIRFLFTTFAEFFQCIGKAPEGYVLDRRDNDGDYVAGNVRWIPRKMSTRNRRPRVNAHGFRWSEVISALSRTSNLNIDEKLRVCEIVLIKLYGLTGPPTLDDLHAQRLRRG